MRASNLWGDQERARSRKAKVAKAKRVANKARHPVKTAGKAVKKGLFG